MTPLPTATATGVRPRPPGQDRARLGEAATVGRFRILRKVGAGGMGVVFAAFDEELERKVALKLLHPAAATPRRRSRLRREARALARLTHPNVVTVYEVGEHRDQVYIAMEFLKGQTVRQWCASSAPNWRAIVRVFVEAGRGLAAAHEAGLVHRDFKPDNVMVQRCGRVQVMDFGLARTETTPLDSCEMYRPECTGVLRRLDAEERPLTQSGAVVGTPGYIAPEQIALHDRPPREPDARSDQFGFCVALYETLHGAMPYAGASALEMARAAHGGMMQPAPGRTPIPLGLRRAIERGIEANPADRWPSMAALLAALEPFTRKERRAWVPTAAALAAVVATATGFVSVADSEPCGSSAAHLNGVWDGGVKRATRDALGDSHRADELLARAVPVLDDYAERWSDARTRTCEATHVHHEQSEASMDRKMACLDRDLDALRAYLRHFAAGDIAHSAEALRAIATMPDPSACARATTTCPTK